MGRGQRNGELDVVRLVWELAQLIVVRLDNTKLEYKPSLLCKRARLYPSKWIECFGCVHAFEHLRKLTRWGNSAFRAIRELCAHLTDD